MNLTNENAVFSDGELGAFAIWDALLPELSQTHYRLLLKVEDQA